MRPRFFASLSMTACEESFGKFGQWSNPTCTQTLVARDKRAAVIYCSPRMDPALVTMEPEPTPHRRLPSWIRQRVPGGERYAYLKNVLREFKLHTVCEEAKCPNLGECWEHGAATFMLMGDVCTRRCNFCAVDKGKPGFLDAAEPEHVAEVVAAMKLDYCVLT